MSALSSAIEEMVPMGGEVEALAVSAAGAVVAAEAVAVATRVEAARVEAVPETEMRRSHSTLASIH